MFGNPWLRANATRPSPTAVLMPSTPNQTVRILAIRPSPATLIFGMSRDSDCQALESTHKTIGQPIARQ
jgi:hypothetical protein